MNNAMILDLPTAGYYVPDFISNEEEQRIIADIDRLPQSKWTALSHRRLLSLPSVLSGKEKDTLLAVPLPLFLEEPIVSRLRSLGVFEEAPHQGPNHVLINEYKSGEGIMPHEDGPSYFPITATVSLQSHTVLEIYKKNERGEREKAPSWRILQEPRSLLITTKDMYCNTLHGISEIRIDMQLSPDTITNWELLGNSSMYSSGTAERATRVSLTYRDVLKVAKVGGAMKFLAKR